MCFSLPHKSMGQQQKTQRTFWPPTQSRKNPANMLMFWETTFYTAGADVSGEGRALEKTVLVIILEFREVSTRTGAKLCGTSDFQYCTGNFQAPTSSVCSLCPN